MSFLRNPEIKIILIILFVITAAAVCTGFVFGFGYGLFALCLCIFFNTAFIIFTGRRYIKIEKLSMEIDLILHGAEAIHLNDYAEGELSILQSEISKMTIQLREQADALKRDKTYLSDSIADISHQIRTPLTSINLIVSFLQNPELTIQRRMELTKDLTKLLSRIDWLISTLLKISKLEAGTAVFRSETVSVRGLMNKAMEPLAIPMELREQELKVDIDGQVSYIGDFSWSVEAATNILKNCMEHTPNGGIICVEASENSIFTEITISDNGRGIDKVDLPHLFERFYKGKNSGDQSFGIGLALSRMIVSEQNGTIKAENNPQSGSKFIIKFFKGVI